MSTAARVFLADRLPVTRILTSSTLSRATGATVLLKMESELPTGSFKVRGALYSLHERMRTGSVSEVVASSTGNHGAAVAYAARELGVHATIFLPEHASKLKRELIRSFGAETVESGRDLAAATVASRIYASERGAFLLHDADDPYVPDGAATIAFELAEQAADVDIVFVPVGDSALIRGVARALRTLSPRATVVGVQACNAPSYYLSWKERRVIETDICDTIAEGLATRIPTAQNVEAICSLVHAMCLVSDAEMLDAMRLLAAEDVRAEPAGAAATAAVLNGSYAIHNRTVVALVTGANYQAVSSRA